MKNITKTIVFIILLTITTPQALAEEVGGKFLHPIHNKEQGEVVYYNKSAGAIEKTVLPQTAGRFEKTEDVDIWFDRFAEHISWSSGGELAVVQTRNTVPPNIPEAEHRFFSQNLELDSLNWWIYNKNNQETTTLDQEKDNIGWFSENEIIYTTNSGLYTSPIENLGERQKIADLRHENGLPPIHTNSYVVLPFGDGVYLINKDDASSVFYGFDAGAITKATIDTTTEHRVLLQASENLVVLFNTETKDYEYILLEFSVKSGAFYNSENIFFISEEDRLYTYNIQTGDTLNISRQDIEGEIKSIYSFGEGVVVMSTIEGMYLYSPPPGLDLETSEGPTNDDDESGVLVFVLIFVVFVAASILLFLYYKKHKNKASF